MNASTDHQEEQPRLRGEAAWNAARERVAARNAQARKAGKQRREAHERERAAARRRAERLEMAALLGKRAAGVPADRD